MNIRKAIMGLVALVFFTGVASADSGKAKKPSNGDEDNELNVEQVVVTSTREAKDLRIVSESVGVLDEEALKQIAPSHPAEALNRIAGVHINNLGGEGHMTSIRQPISTSGVYLFLEDGLPTRPTGFFNHNGLYEINIPQSSRVEVTKGPGSALYGSDAIGGVINSITKKASAEKEASLNTEFGSDDWQRALLTVGGGKEEIAVRFDVNSTQNEGFREEADYDRQSYTLRLDSTFSEGVTAKVVGSYSEINQSGVSSLLQEDFENNTTKNRFHDDIGFREVEAFRLSSELNFELNEEQLITVTPFYRVNEMTMMPSWMVTYDPNIRDYEFQSYGALLKYRHNLFDEAVQVIVGSDLDFTPSEYFEEGINLAFDAGEDVYTDYSRSGSVNYNFSADQQTVSPYVHLEYQATEQIRFNGGVRYDQFDVDYTNNIDVATEGRHLRAESQKISYSNTSPKLGATYQYLDDHNAYLSYRHAFRAPTVGTLFRPGLSVGSTDLNPVKSLNQEIGFRGDFAKRFKYEVAYYDMEVRDDIVSIVDGDDLVRVNAGETSHKGIELGLDMFVSNEWIAGVSFTQTEQRYKDFSYVSRGQELNFAGNDVTRAPESLANLRLAYFPKKVEGLRVEIEWDSVGEYFTDETNTQKYDGHELWNLRVNYEMNSRFTMNVRAINITDELYSTFTRKRVGGNDSDLEYRPGAPRSVFFGLTLNLL